MTKPITLPSGLIIHCNKCGLVVPSDAPQPPDSGCEFVALHRLSWFNPNETPAGQHVMAVCTWAMIYDTALKAAEPASKAYHNAYRASRKAHYQSSAVYKALSGEQRQDGARHKRDGSLYTPIATNTATTGVISNV